LSTSEHDEKVIMATNEHYHKEPFLCVFAPSGVVMKSSDKFADRGVFGRGVLPLLIGL
jgi:hypothetical protein